jgi:hypothetical protein
VRQAIASQQECLKLLDAEITHYENCLTGSAEAAPTR